MGTVCIFSYSRRRQRVLRESVSAKSVRVRALPQAVSLGGFSKVLADRAQHAVVRQRDEAQGELFIGKHVRV